MEYPYCCLESQTPDPINADTNFDFGVDPLFSAKAEIYTTAKELAKQIKALKSQHPECYDDLNESIYSEIDLQLGDGTNILYSLISQIAQKA